MTIKARHQRRTTPPTSAAEAYRAHAADIARLLDVLQMELDRHAEAAKTNPKDWGYAGSLGKVRYDLLTLIGFLTSMEPQEVEAFLAD